MMKQITLLLLTCLLFLFGCGESDDSSNPLNYPTDGLMAYFPFDNDWGDEVTPNNFVESHSAQPTFKSDKDGNENSAIFFSGAGEYLTLNLQQFSTENGFTISGFVRNEIQQPIIWQDFLAEKENNHISLATRTAEVSRHGYSMFFLIDLDTEAMVESYSHSSPADVSTWHHLALSFDGEILRHYFDGELVNQFLVGEEYNGTPVYQSYFQFVLGSSFDQTSFWRGCIDELFFYTRALADNEIIDLYLR